MKVSIFPTMAANIRLKTGAIAGVVDIDLHIRRKLLVWPSAVGGREPTLVSSSETGLVVLTERRHLLCLVWRVEVHLVPRELPLLQLHVLDLLLELLHVVLHEGAYHDPYEKCILYILQTLMIVQITKDKVILYSKYSLRFATCIR